MGMLSQIILPRAQYDSIDIDCFIPENVKMAPCTCTSNSDNSRSMCIPISDREKSFILTYTTQTRRN